MKQALRALAATTISVVVASLFGCGGPADTPVTAASTFDCAAVAKFALGDNIQITQAGKVEANTAKPLDSRGAPTGAYLPAHCVVQGAMNTRTGKAFATNPANGTLTTVDTTYAIKFELRLPKDWNGRFFFHGGGGLDGELAQAVGVYDFAQGPAVNALSRGFAVVSTDAGHQSPLLIGNFGADQQARLDYAYNALDLVTVTAKDIINRYYGRTPDKSYFIGFSNGGRQAMLMSQRFPSYFDGIVAGSPGFNLTHSAVNQIGEIQAIAAALPPSTPPTLFGPDLAKAYSQADLALIKTSITNKCDVKGRDTVMDGIISDVEACDFNIQADIPTCAGANDGTCLSAAQKTALEKVMAGSRNSQGTALYSDFFFDTNVGSFGWSAWKLGGFPIPLSPTLTTTASLNQLIAPESVGKVFSTPAFTAFNPLTYNLDTDPARTVEYGKIFNTVFTDLSQFREHGGKLIVFHGNSDPVFSSKDTINYFKKLNAANNGDASSFARLFLVPGMTHGADGSSPDGFDTLTAIQNWVENGIAPDSMIAKAGPASAWPNRTRPLCPYPQVAVYNGAGSLDDAANFSCR